MEKTSFSVGDSVLIVQFKRKGRIVAGPNQKGEFQVDCGGLPLWISAEKLALSDATPQKTAVKSSTKRRRKEVTSVGSSTLRLDLHGMRKDQALEKLEEMIDRAMRSEGARGESVCIELIHGLGTGTLRDAVWRYLKDCRVVSSFRQDSKNPGVTWIYL